MLIILGLIALLITGANSKGFDWRIANTSVWLSSGTYCPTSTYLNRSYHGYSKGFVPTSVIYDEESDTQGYMGYVKSQKTFYVVFRGSVSVKNWIDDLDAILVNYPGCDGCMVHEGFYYAQQRVAEAVRSDVAKFRKKNPSYKVVVTGHSLGGALASLTALDLIESGFRGIRLFNFGSPRIGDTDLALYASKQIEEHYRITHYRDAVLHCPLYIFDGAERFIHMSGEWYENEFGQLEQCNSDELEDLKCSSRWYYTTIEDHMKYLGLAMGCSSVSLGLYANMPISPEEEAREEHGHYRSGQSELTPEEEAQLLWQHQGESTLNRKGEVGEEDENMYIFDGGRRHTVPIEDEEYSEPEMEFNKEQY